MKALTIYQPWASLIALGAKTIETRSWRTSYRGPLAIHAGTTLALLGDAPDAWRAFPLEVYTSTRSADAPRRFPPDVQSVDPLPRGAVVATATLVDCVPINPSAAQIGEGADGLLVLSDRGEGGWWPFGAHLRGDERTYGPAHHYVAGPSEQPYGDFAPGRWAWLLANVQPLTRPVPAKGRQGLWEWDR